MARGNQRDKAREAAAKKANSSKKSATETTGMSYAKRKELDAEAVRAKQAAAKAAKEAAGQGK